MSTATVTVGCKLPHGLKARIFVMADASEALRDGTTRPIKQARQVGEPIVFKGYLERYQPNLPPAARMSSVAYTEGVPLDFWEQWVAQNHDLDALRNGLVFAQRDMSEARAQGRDLANVTVGLEPIDPDSPQYGIKIKPYNAKDND